MKVPSRIITNYRLNGCQRKTHGESLNSHRPDGVKAISLPGRMYLTKLMSLRINIAEYSVQKWLDANNLQYKMFSLNRFVRHVIFWSKFSYTFKYAITSSYLSIFFYLIRNIMLNKVMLTWLIQILFKKKFRFYLLQSNSSVPYTYHKNISKITILLNWKCWLNRVKLKPRKLCKLLFITALLIVKKQFYNLLLIVPFKVIFILAVANSWFVI